MKDENAIEKLKGLYYTKKEPRKTFIAFLRNQNKMCINSFNMIDRKAAIMIRLNATIIPAVIIFSEYLTKLEHGNFIGITMLICSFISLMFAMNASRPHTFSFFKRYREKVEKKYTKLEENIFGIGMNHNITLEQYEEAYDKLINSQELQVGNQIRTLYIFESQIKKALYHIEIAYASFMIGFLIVVIAFISNNLMHNIIL
ncbi:hypothetical protein [Aquimarina sp. AU119]|uniref:hypothetical protein n=1 Tax=Aquimarina sp. AU119 TaxID=2108528 RepID=UPI000D699A07|nr:hypothetical protein [Aquimarina sp. AU119]